MTNDARHFDEELSELVDNRLDGASRAEVDAHLAVCPTCRARLDDLRRLKAALAASSRSVTMPPELHAQIGRALDREDRRRSGLVWNRAPLLLAASVLLVVAATAIFLVSRSSRVPIVDVVAQDFRAYTADRLALDLRTNSPQELEAFFVQRGIRFPARVFDFGMMKYELTGGRVHTLGERPSALYTYRAADSSGPAGRVLVCQMFPGSVNELPSPAVVRNQNGIAFHVFRRGELTLVFWQEGEIICVLTSDGDSEAVVQFAFAKAIKV